MESLKFPESCLPPPINKNVWEDCCEHVWESPEDFQDLSLEYGTVVCSKCGCYGEITHATGEVFYPAT